MLVINRLLARNVEYVGDRDICWYNNSRVNECPQLTDY